MPTQAKDLRHEIIEKVVGQVRQRMAGETGAVERFVAQYFEDVGTEFLLEPGAENLYGSVLSLWSFAQKRQPGRPKVRVFNPRQEEHGWTSTHTVVEVVNDDMPFLVDSVVNALNRQQLIVHLLIHPIMRIARDASGQLADVADPETGGVGVAESILHVEISQRSSVEALEAIREEIGRVLTDVRLCVEDWRAMRAKVSELVEELESSPPPLGEDELEEGKAFLSWIRDDNFTLLGVRDYRLEKRKGQDFLHIVEDSGLGVLREVSAESAERHRNALPQAQSEFARRKELLIITKASARSTVHRPVYMDYVGVRRFGPKGEAIGERRILGLFTSTAYNRNPREIPLLRHKVRMVAGRSGYAPGSHNAKAILNILETYPRDELFQIAADELFDTALGILHLEERQRIRLFVRRDRHARFFSCLVYVPRDRYNTALRERIQDILCAAFQGEAVDFTTHISDQPMARVHFIVRTPHHSDETVDVDQVEERIVAASRNWTDDLLDALVDRMGEARGHDLFHRYREAFPPGFQHSFSAQAAVADIERVEEVLAGAPIAMNLYRRVDAPEDALYLKLFHGGEPVPLSDILPMLENMGLRVVTEHPFTITAAGTEQRVYIHDFLMRQQGAVIDLGRVRENFQEAFARIWHAEMEDDGLNRLVIAGGLSWRQVVVLRALTRYLRQARATFSQTYIEDTLCAHPMLARLLVSLFEARFDPDGGERARVRAEELEDAFREGVDKVESLDEDRILRRFLNLLTSAVRTNHFQPGADGAPKPYLAIKFDSSQLDELPKPRPWREIWVYSPRMEGIHLRGGKVARGGIRWSDRREDFRTEVLGLMKAQTVKNALIVPVGAKGGFVLKQPPAEGGREALMAEGIACYKTLIRGMLELTDNRVGDEVVPPPRVVRHDEEDPYIVAAADKGTATFSDIANGLSAEYGYWLSDAFASGGSAGYDHKEMGITARGAWESVKRHFRELGFDVHKQDFAVVGVGDMSGDVFGNGMLLSPHIRLLGAFNHLHIFVDPDPDPEKSLAERRRMFELPRSSWADYDRALISKGGGVFERSSKAVKLTPEIQRAFGIAEETLPPQALIQAMLRAEVDLLWFGGIGTYVKAHDETHPEVDDRSNDALRVDGRELRAKVVGEGANLGVTQRGRIEYALAGGRINTDAIDNSGGVDASDHEVNIKILLNAIVGEGDLTMKQRDALLEEMTDEVAHLVLRDNYQQTQAISVMASRAPEMLDDHVRFMRVLERAGRLDRALEFLPDEEAIADRAEAGLGLTRPEIAILLAYSKISLYGRLLDSDLPDDPLLIEDLRRYFPKPIRKRFPEALMRHRLRREIIATHVTNSMVNRVGASFVNEMELRTGRPGSDVARAYAITRDAFGLRDLWLAIEALDNKVPANLQTRMITETSRLVERATLWFLRNGEHPLDVAGTVKTFGADVAQIASHLDEIVTDDRREHLERVAAEMAAEGVPQDLALRVANLDVLVSACDLVRLARTHGHDVLDVARVYFSLGSRFGLHWLRRSARAIGNAGDAWLDQAIEAVVDDIFSHQSAMTLSVLKGKDDQPVDGQTVERWAEARGQQAVQAVELVSTLREEGAIDLARLAVASRRLRALAEA